MNNRVKKEQIDVLTELINIGVGRAASVLNEMTNTHILLQIPRVQILQANNWDQEIERIIPKNGKISTIQLGFSGEFSGTVALFFTADSASKLVTILTAEETISVDLNSLRVGTLTEIGNILINNIMGSIGNMLKKPLSFSIPQYGEDDIEHLLNGNLAENASMLLVNTHFELDQKHVDGTILMLFEVETLNNLIKEIML